MSVSLSIYEKEHAARERYVYFICGVSGALLAYIGKDYRPDASWTRHDTLVIVTLASLLVSFLFGLLRILFYVEGMSTNRDIIVIEEEVENITNVLIQHKTQQSVGHVIALDKHTGKQQTMQDLQDRITALNTKKQPLVPKMNRWHDWSTIFLVICHFFLIAGMSFLVLSKMT
jgi:hypothetical protein